MNRQQLLSRLGRRGWPVVYGNGALSIWDRQSWRAAPVIPKVIETDSVYVQVAGRLLPTWPTHPRYTACAVALYCAFLQRRTNGGNGPSIAYLFWPSFLPYALRLGCEYVIYHAVDSYHRMPGWTAELQELQRAIVSRADLVIGTNPDVLDGLPAGGCAPRRVLGNGVDSAAFAQGPHLSCPNDLAGVPHPRICYAGHLNRKVDFNLVAQIAHTRPAWHWVFVGPIQEGLGHPSNDPNIAEGYRMCRRLPNVHFLGSKTLVDLPAYVGHADVNVMCYRSDGEGWWRTLSPLKLHEYLASGKPVIGTPLPAVQQFAHVVDLANTEEEWIAAIERAVQQGGIGTPAERRAVANENTWDVRVDQLQRWMHEMLAGKADMGGKRR